jgi:hypothetical protein
MARYQGSDQDIQAAYDYYTKRIGRKSARMSLKQFSEFHYGRVPEQSRGDAEYNVGRGAGLSKEQLGKFYK